MRARLCSYAWQPAAGLRIGDEFALPFRGAGGQHDILPVALPVPVGGSGRNALLEPFDGFLDVRYRSQSNFRVQVVRKALNEIRFDWKLIGEQR